MAKLNDSMGSNYKEINLVPETNLSAAATN